MRVQKSALIGNGTAELLISVSIRIQIMTTISMTTMTFQPSMPVSVHLALQPQTQGGARNDSEDRPRRMLLDEGEGGAREEVHQLGLLVELQMWITRDERSEERCKESCEIYSDSSIQKQNFGKSRRYSCEHICCNAVKYI
jgi:hypothetical protein